MPRLKLILLSSILTLTGCRSRFVEVTIVNHGPALHVMEFDYPTASFGVNQLTPGAEYHYRFKVQGPGALSFQYEDQTGRTKTFAGPHVALGDEGEVRLTLNPGGGVTWTTHLTQPH